MKQKPLFLDMLKLLNEVDAENAHLHLGKNKITSHPVNKDGIKKQFDHLESLFAQ